MDIKAFRKKVKAFVEAPARKDRTNIKGEAMTNTSLIYPFVRLLGYDTESPTEFRPERNASFVKKGKKDKIDHVVYDVKNGQPILLIETKDCQFSLTNENVGQLRNYFGKFAEQGVKIALLTNGVNYLFLTDLTDTNVLDAKPFFSFNIDQYSDNDVEILYKFCKEQFNVKAIRGFAKEFQGKNDKAKLLAETPGYLDAIKNAWKAYGAVCMILKQKGIAIERINLLEGRQFSIVLDGRRRQGTGSKQLPHFGKIQERSVLLFHCTCTVSFIRVPYIVELYPLFP